MNSNEFLISLYKKNTSNRIRKYIERIIVKKEKGYAFSKTLRRIYADVYNIQIGYGSYGGCFNTAHIPGGVQFGNYCSVANNVLIFRANHPPNTFTSHPLLYNPVMGYVKKDMLTRLPLIIGHDVWIGANVVILPGVKTIGNGAMIGAGSIVTKDVVPYSIIAGNPAKQIKQRFNDSVIENLEQTKWWTLEFDDLISKVEKFNSIVNGSN